MLLIQQLNMNAALSTISANVSHMFELDLHMYNVLLFVDLNAGRWSAAQTLLWPGSQSGATTIQLGSRNRLVRITVIKLCG